MHSDIPQKLHVLKSIFFALSYTRREGRLWPVYWPKTRFFNFHDHILRSVGKSNAEIEVCYIMLLFRRITTCLISGRVPGSTSGQDVFLSNTYPGRSETGLEHPLSVRSPFASNRTMSLTSGYAVILFAVTIKDFLLHSQGMPLARLRVTKTSFPQVILWKHSTKVHMTYQSSEMSTN